MAWNSSLKTWAKTVMRDVVALSLAARDSRVPWYVLPLGIALAVKLIPPEIMAEHRAAALAVRARPTSFAAAAVVIAAWIAAAVLATWALWPTVAD